MKELFKTWLVERYIAHRGLHDNKIPENSMLAFEKAISEGFPIETDVQMISDGTIIVFHDESLARMTGKDGYTKSLTKKELKNTFLQKTEQTILTLEELLQLVDGKVPLLIEIKNYSKVGEVEQKIWELLKNYDGEYAIQSFNPYVLDGFKEHAPTVIRGQLAGFFKGEKSLPFLKRFALKHMILNKKVEPDFIAYEARVLPNFIVKRWNKLPLIAWTIQSQEEYLRVIKHCDNIIFENFIPKI